jgi:hypothetical protein
MGMPKSVTRLSKDGVTFISSVDRCSYTIRELTRAALRDVGKYVCVEANKKAQKLYYASMKKSKRVRGTKGSFQYWARAKSCDLQVGIKHSTWYGTEQELGSSKMRKHGILTTSVQDNIATIVKIESQYLSALEDEARALILISEEVYKGGGDE